MKHQIGDIIKGKVTGIQPYGAFVQGEDGLVGLVHISELSDGFVKDVSVFAKVGDVLNLKIIDLDKKTHQARLSLKAVSRSRSRYRPHPMASIHLPPHVLGFSSLAQHLDAWIQEAKEKTND